MHRFARWGTELLAPWVWVLGLPLAVAWMATGRVGPTLLWGLLVAVTGSLIPMAVIVRGARKGKWDGHHVTNRAGRAVPLLVAGISLGTGFVVLVVWHAPDEIIALAASMLASLVVSVAITFGFKFKISLHAAVAVSALVVLIFTYGPWAWVLLPLVIWVCWSRVELGDHTRSEVLSGAVMGLVVGGFGFWAILAAIQG
ncbi:PAP2 superfamily protein [Amycolatopsis xylanica]|uniref:PAP2 superfamily protein n=1 Tax=Amycolatopsis xylanica TaxID=589385 RepID=A0A1H3Q8K5_9PSEU|nr:phosphatase PAP2 family protein [Amycolatopsis xylanica]SDZ09491.1 PAP2 superfamily protein [Amycolatopsis xylanica]